MERKHFLIHRHTSHIDNMPTDLKLGEIAVRHHDEKPELIINLDEANGDFRTFIDKEAVEKLITATSTNISGEIDSLSGAIESIHTELEKYDTAEEAQVKIDAAKDAAIAAASAYTDGQVSAAEGRMNTKIQGVDAKVTALTETVANNQTAVDNKFKGYYTSAQTDTAITEAKDAAIAAASAYTDDQVSSAEGRMNTKIQGVDAKVDTLVGVDSGKTARSIAVEEVAKVVSGAPAAFDTLKEIADWIGTASGVSAATLVADIENLKKADETLTQTINGVAADVTALSGVVENHVEAVAEEFKKYDTAEEAQVKIDAAKDAAIAAASAYTDGQVSAAEGRMNTKIQGVDAKVTALTETVANNQTAVDNKFKGYYTSAQTDTAITEAKDAAIAAASAYTDGQVSSAEGRMNTKIQGVDAKVAALTETVANNQTAVDNKFKGYYTSAQTDTAITEAKDAAIAAASAYTDGQVSSAKTELTSAINGVSSRVVSLENISGLTLTAIQNITGLSGATITGETQRTIDFSNMIIDCGEF